MKNLKQTNEYYENNQFYNFYNFIYDIRKIILKKNDNDDNYLAIICHTCYEKINYREIFCGFDKIFCTNKCRIIYIKKYKNC